MMLLKVDFNELIGDEKSVKLVANLPYYLTTPIIVNLLTKGYNFKSLTIMIQKEVAQKNRFRAELQGLWSFFNISSILL